MLAYSTTNIHNIIQCWQKATFQWCEKTKNRFKKYTTPQILDYIRISWFCRINYFSLAKVRELERWTQFLNPIIAIMPSPIFVQFMIRHQGH